jgi:hypothetical protein
MRMPDRLRRRVEVPRMVRKWFAAAAIALLTAVGTGAAATAAPRSGDDSLQRPAKPFKPKKLVGQWEGQYTNTTFSTTGPASATVVAPGKKFGLTLDLGGNVFACGDPPEGPLNLLKKGKGPNTWNEKGFRVSKDTPALGHIEMTYKFKSKAITGTGAPPPCLPGITYTFTGSLTTTQMVLSIDIDLGNGQTAHTDFVVNKV